MKLAFNLMSSSGNSQNARHPLRAPEDGRDPSISRLKRIANEGPPVVRALPPPRRGSGSARRANMISRGHPSSRGQQSTRGQPPSRGNVTRTEWGVRHSFPTRPSSHWRDNEDRHYQEYSPSRSVSRLSPSRYHPQDRLSHSKAGPSWSTYSDDDRQYNSEARHNSSPMPPGREREPVSRTQGYPIQLDEYQSSNEYSTNSAPSRQRRPPSPPIFQKSDPAPLHKAWRLESPAEAPQLTRPSQPRLVPPNPSQQTKRVSSTKNAVDGADVKPIITAFEQTSPSQQMEGVLAIMRNEAPSECYSSDTSIRGRARAQFRLHTNNLLRAEGKNPTSTMWRDDGVAFNWRRNDTTQPKTDSLAVRTKAALSKFPASNSRSIEPALQPPSTTHSTEQQTQPAEPTWSVTIIPYPAEFNSPESRRTDEYIAWRQSQVRVHEMPDIDGQAMRHVERFATAKGLNIRSYPLLGSKVVPKVSATVPPAKRDRETSPNPPKNSSPAKRKKAVRESKDNPPMAEVKPKHTQTKLEEPSKISKSSKRSQHDSGVDNVETQGNAEPVIPAAGPPHSRPTPLQKEISQTLQELRDKMRQSLDKIHRWTRLEAEFPELADNLRAQTKRTEQDIFDLQNEIDEEKGRLARLAA